MKSKKYFLIDLLIWLIAHNLPIIMVYLLKLYFDINYKDNLFVILIAYGVLFILRLVLIKIGANVDIEAQHEWSNILYECIIKKVQKSIDTSKSMSNHYIDIINNDITAIVGTISYAIDTFSNVLGTIIAFIIMATINIYISVLILIVPIVVFLISNTLKNKIYLNNDNIRKNETNLINIYQSMIENSREIRIYSKEKMQYNDYKKVLNKTKNDNIMYGKFKSLLMIINEFMIDVNIIIILLGFIISNSFSVGELALFISYSFIINDLSLYISNFTITYSELGVYIHSFNSKIKCEGLLNTTKVDSSISKNLDLVKKGIKRGAINILIGKNGSGKTRILKKLAELDGYTLVVNNSSIISESLYENIVLDNDDRKYDAVKDIFCLGNLDERNRLSDKELSGGQIDRISVARAIMGNEQVIMIDKNLLSIDLEVRNSIIKGLEKSGSTILLVDQKDKDEYKYFNKIFI